MLKPAHLRDHLSRASSELQQNPDKLAVFIERGNLICAYGNTLSFEYAYTLKLVVLDFSGHADAIMVPLLAWLKRYQPDIFENEDRRAKAIRFEAELLNQETVDLSIEVDLTEAVAVKPGPEPADPSTAKRYAITHLAEPAHVGIVTEPTTIEVTIGTASDEQLLASWSFDPPQDG